MLKIIYSQLTSLDGYIEDADGNISCIKPGDELHRHFNELKWVDYQTFPGDVVMLKYQLKH
ncbi:hypothetical protein DYD21_20220 [Rhodohalobacter sp. SW132]|uniref:hypothetical protein n=1 Tax=Rhodohalobacter sp. SW132 TaxID=2293433 RepID=UPI000E2345B6|nr:hypothetical protein [Rhodohalobacter sp. SW132]REL24013.1 hypothetical protein DYD21_20220 [Rhodohalobacter sp. SW132]